MKGTVKWYDENKGYGFIQSGDNKDFFVHSSGLKSAFNGLDIGQEVEFESRDSEKGPVAINVANI